MSLFRTTRCNICNGEIKTEKVSAKGRIKRSSKHKKRTWLERMLDWKYGIHLCPKCKRETGISKLITYYGKKRSKLDKRQERLIKAFEDLDEPFFIEVKDIIKEECKKL